MKVVFKMEAPIHWIISVKLNWLNSKLENKYMAKKIMKWFTTYKSIQYFIALSNAIVTEFLKSLKWKIKSEFKLVKWKKNHSAYFIYVPYI